VTVSELAFLGLGLLLGAASGAALFVVIGSRIPRREIRVTVTPNALPRRSETLSQGAFVTSPAEPARGGPGDRRVSDRDAAAPLDAADAGSEAAPAPVAATARTPIGIPIGPGAGAPPDGNPYRTIVPNAPARPAAPGPTAPRTRPQVTTTVPVGVATAVAVERDVEPERELEVEQASHRSARGSVLERMLRGEHRAMADALDAVAGEDGRSRREWERLLGGLVEMLAEMAARESVIDFPMGTPFWDSFTVEQCRRIVAALASMGYRYDGRDGWVEGRAPAYRDLAQALADIGVDPRRIRAWPNSTEIAALFVGARPAPEELLAAAGPAYHAEHMRELVGERADDLADLWLAWEAVRPVLVEEHLAAA
jgi:hypothetical protein